ncbi:MAG: (Fe-S)-binding protein, partial [bacterium]
RLAALLTASGLDICVAGELEHCCGLPFYWKGNRQYFMHAAASIARLFRESGAQRVITLSGSCLGAMRSKYPEYGVEPGVEVVHASEVLAELLQKGRLKLKKKVNAGITYHDPCYLGRQSEPFVKQESEEKLALNLMTYTDPPRQVNRGANGVYDPPRRLLRAIPGADFNEMYRIREYSFCCGGGGGAPEAFPGLAESAALHRLEEARAVGADVLATACSHCRAQFERAQEKLEADKRTRIADVVDLVFEASGLSE